jgi:RNA polymerase sigma-70 factor, ECF subfamily
MPKNDNKLVKAALKNQEAFGELVDRYDAKLARYIRRFTGLSKECTEDILQEVFLKIYKNLNNFDQALKFSSWAYRIAHNEAINHLRKNKTKTLSLETDEEDAVNLIEVLKSDTDIAKETSKKELQEKVQELLRSLPENYKEILILRFLEDLEYTEISDILKKPIGTIGTLINRAKAQFKQLAIKHQLYE